jgi:hypothetical protein
MSDTQKFFSSGKSFNRIRTVLNRRGRNGSIGLGNPFGWKIEGKAACFIFKTPG